MRRGIGLRGYAQQDPLNEFRKEAFRLYEELRDLIRRQVATTIFRVTVQARAADDAAAGPGPAGAAGAGGNRRRPAPRPHGQAAAGGAAASAGSAARRRSPPDRRPCASRARTPRPCGACRRTRCAAPVRRRAPAPRRGRSRQGFTPSGRGSAATSPAGAAPARSTRSATGADPQPDQRSWCASWSSAVRRHGRRGGCGDRAHLAARAIVTSSGRWTRSSSSAPRSTTDGRRRCSRPASITPWPSGSRVSPGVRRHRRQAPRRPHHGGGRGPRIRDRARRAGVARSSARTRPTTRSTSLRAVADELRGARACTARCSSRTRPTCSGCCGSPSDLGIEAYGSPTPTPRLQRDARPPCPGDRPRARSAGRLLPHRRGAARSSSLGGAGRPRPDRERSRDRRPIVARILENTRNSTRFHVRPPWNAWNPRLYSAQVFAPRGPTPSPRLRPRNSRRSRPAPSLLRQRTARREGL